MAKIIFKQDIPRFLDLLQEKYLVWAPVRANKNLLSAQQDDFIFAPLNPYGSRPSTPTQLALNYPTTIIPPLKNAFFPPQEILFTWQNDPTSVAKGDLRGTNKISEPAKIPDQVLFGVHLYDIHAIALMNDVTRFPVRDDLWRERLAKTLIIGISHEPQEYHFWGAIGLDIHTGYDLFLQDIGKAYAILEGSDKGKKLIANLNFIKDVPIPEKSQEKPQDKLLNLPLIEKVVKKGAKSKIWDKLAKICFGCGICAYVCPLCYCFETSDWISLDGKSGSRSRRWDACFLPNFFAIAGVNPKEKLRDRIYNWYHHKFVRFPAEYGRVGCIGCGRCIHYCPAKINFREVLEDLEKEAAE